MDTIKLSLQGAWELLYTGMFLGAGLPIMFALGVKLIAGATLTADVTEDGIASPPSQPGLAPKALAGVFFALVAFAVIVGLLTIVGAGMGKEVSFENIYPTLVEKA